jgi:hypothetical protein
MGLDPGPLETPPLAESSRTMVGVAVDRRETVSIGIYVPAPASALGLRLQSVELLDPGEGLVSVGALVSTGRRSGSACVGAGRTFPPQGCSLQGVDDWSIPRAAVADQGFQIVLGLELVGTDDAGFAGLAVDYLDPADGSRYRAIFMQGGVLCAPRSRYEDAPADCPGKEQLLRDQEALVDSS